MTIVCSKCGQMFNSVILDKKLAWDELFQQVLKHSDKKHREVLAALQAANQKISFVIATYLTCSELVIIPEDEKWIQEKMENMQEIIMQSVGFDPEEDEEDEEEEIDNEVEIGIVELPDTEESIDVREAITGENDADIKK